MLVIDLQRFAGEKTERATPKRRQEARKKGQIPRSADLTSAVALLAALVALRVFGPQVWQSLASTMQFDFSHSVAAPLTEQATVSLLAQETWTVVKIVGPLILVILVVGFATAFAQVGPAFLPGLLTPDLSRINIVSGFRRFFTARSLVDLAKSVLKLTIVGVLCYVLISNMAGSIANLGQVDVGALVGFVGSLVFRLGIEIAAIMVVLAGLDFLFQRYDFEKSIRMSKDEIKDERRQQDGDQRVRAEIRKRGRNYALRRMMQDVPKADVVVTNPTHFAVALRYESGTMAAPVVVAKGQDLTAQRIREVATEAGVPLVENKPLAQTLFRTVDIGWPVPADLYQAVAEVLAYVYRLRQMHEQGVSR